MSLPPQVCRVIRDDHIYAVDRLEPVKVFSGHTGAVKKAIFMDAKRICTASDDKTAK